MLLTFPSPQKNVRLESLVNVWNILWPPPPTPVDFQPRYPKYDYQIKVVIVDRWLYIFSSMMKQKIINVCPTDRSPQGPVR